MKLALAIGYSGATLDVPIELIQHAERLGFDSVWTAEAYGSDAITPLAWIAAQTERIRLGTGIMQLAGAPAGDVRDAVHDRRRARRRRPDDRRARRVRARRSSRAGTASRGASRTGGCATTSRSCARSSSARSPSSHDGREISLPVHRAGRDRAGQAAALDPPRRPGAADLDGLGQGGHRAADRRAVRRLAADALRARPHGRVPPVAGGGLRPGAGRRARHGLAQLRDPGPGRRADHRRRRPARSPRRSRASPCTSAAWAPAR